MQNYLNLCKKAISSGIRKQNRTGIDHIGYHGGVLYFDLSTGLFPIVTTRKIAYKTCFAEFLGFIRGYQSAEQFRRLGVKYWDANANENKTWLSNPNRKGTDDLGRIYGVQARKWLAYEEEPGDNPFTGPLNQYKVTQIDQLKKVVDNLKKGIDDRREIVTHWNPGELDKMALPPCHCFYQFGLQGEYLNMAMYQRSCDMPLGVPFDIVGYAWLLSVIAHITGKKPGKFMHILWDIHVYVNQHDLLLEQLRRKPLPLPKLIINPGIRTLTDLETLATVDDFVLEGYEYHDPINYPMAL